MAMLTRAGLVSTKPHYVTTPPTLIDSPCSLNGCGISVFAK